MNQKLIVTDYDGTLASNHGAVSSQNRALLDQLGQEKHIRVIATGRNLYSVKKVIDRNFPIDYVIFTTGAGIIHWPSQKILVSHHLDEKSIQTTFDCFKRNQMDFMIHQPIPDNHYFQFFSTGFHNEDFVFRKRHYGLYCREGNLNSLPSLATQFVGVLRPEQSERVFNQIKTDLHTLNTVRATSPFDHKSIWVEVFSHLAGKHRAADFLLKELNLSHTDTVAIGNDYNDIDLLSWAEKAYVVQNGIEELKDQHEVVSSAEEHGFSEAIKRFFKKA